MPVSTSAGRPRLRKLFWPLLLLPLIWPLTVLLVNLAPSATPPPAAGASPVAGSPSSAPWIAHETIFQPVPEFARFHAATLALAPNGDLLAACRGDRPGASRSSWDLGAVILFSRKTPTAKTWSPPVAISATPDRMDTNPVLWTDPAFGGPDGKGGRIWLFHGTSFGVGWQFSRVSCRYSDDYGVTWSDRRPVTGVENLNTRCPPVSVPLPGGGRRIVLPVYREFGQSLCLCSTDNGETWEESEPIVSGIVGNFQPSLILRADHSIDAYMRASGMQKVLTAHSPDGGLHWSPVQPIDLNNPFTSVAAASLPGEETALVFNNTTEADRLNLSVALQHHPAEPWFSTPREVAPPGTGDQPQQQEYPAVLVLPDGRLLIAYTYGRDQIDLATCNRSWVLAGDPGVAGGWAWPGWRGLPALVALLLFIFAAGLRALVWRRWPRSGFPAAPGAETATAPNDAFRIFILAGEALLLVLLFAFGPRGAGVGDWCFLAADNFRSCLAALVVTAWLLLAAALVQAIVRLRAPVRAVLVSGLWLAAPLTFGTIAAAQLIWPPADPAFGALTHDHPFPPLPPDDKLAAQARAELIADYRYEYRVREQVAREAGPGDPPETILARFETLRGQLDDTFAATRGLTPAQLAALSPYETGERYVQKPPLQTNAPLFLRAAALAIPQWILALVLTFFSAAPKPISATKNLPVAIK